MELASKVILDKTNQLETAKEVMETYESQIEIMNKAFEAFEKEKSAAEMIKVVLKQQISLAKEQIAGLLQDLRSVFECSICQDLPDKVI